MPRRRKGARVLGPIKIDGAHRGGSDSWRVITVGEDGSRRSRDFGKEALAKAYAQVQGAHIAELEETTVEAAVFQWRDQKLITRARNKQRSAEIKVSRVMDCLRPRLRSRVGSLTTEAIARCYRGRYERGVLVEHGSMTRPTRFGRPPAVATHHAELAAVKSFLDWCVEEGLIAKNPAAEIEPEGEPESGKPQLNEDEANLWLATACEFALEGDVGAVATMIAFVVALRAGEIVSLTKRQLDADTTVVWVIRGKTKRARRRLSIPTEMEVGRVLRACLRSIGAGKGPEDPIFGRHRPEWVRSNVHRICRAAGVPLVSAHGLRGTHATLAEEEGSTAENMLRSLGHESRGVQHQAYIQPGASERGTQRRAMAKLHVVRDVDEDVQIQWRPRGVRKSPGARVKGPYKTASRGRRATWRVILFADDGTRSGREFVTEAQAVAFVEACRRGMEGEPVESTEVAK